MIKLNNVSKKYDVYIRGKFLKRNHKIIDAVTDISFEISKGEIVGLLGFNGAGKTTLIKLMTGILTASSGTISVNDFNPSFREKEYLNSIGVLLGNRSCLFYDLPIQDTYEYLESVYNLDKNETKTFIEPLLEALSIKDLLTTPVRKLSLGQRRKAELVASIINNPKVLFLDEPSIGLDVISKKELISFIKLLSQKYKTTIIYTSHDLNEIENCCKRIIFLENGQVTYDGSIDKFKNKKNLFKIKITFNHKIDNITQGKILDDYSCCALIEKQNLKDYISQFNPDDIDSIDTSEPTLEDVMVDYVE